MGKINIKVGVGVGGANKRGVGGIDIEVGKKVRAKAIASTENNADGGSKIIDQHASFVSFAFITFAIANCANNSNVTVLKNTFKYCYFYL